VDKSQGNGTQVGLLRKNCDFTKSHFLAEMEESFWGDVYGETRLVWKRLLEADSQRQRDRYAVRKSYQRRHSRRQPYRNGLSDSMHARDAGRSGNDDLDDAGFIDSTYLGCVFTPIFIMRLGLPYPVGDALAVATHRRNHARQAHDCYSCEWGGVLADLHSRLRQRPKTKQTQVALATLD
jgi:hypothetical protein